MVGEDTKETIRSGSLYITGGKFIEDARRCISTSGRGAAVATSSRQRYSNEETMVNNSLANMVTRKIEIICQAKLLEIFRATLSKKNKIIHSSPMLKKKKE